MLRQRVIIFLFWYKSIAHLGPTEHSEQNTLGDRNLQQTENNI